MKLGPVLLVLAAACAPDWHGGIHARMGWNESTGLRVVEVPPDGPAARAGLEVGDRITSIAGEPIDGMPMRAVVERLRGPVGSEVELGILRQGERRTIRVERAPYAEDDDQAEQ
jgi:C-terminal processing protease CtpA/Prc